MGNFKLHCGCVQGDQYWQSFCPVHAKEETERHERWSSVDYWANMPAKTGWNSPEYQASQHRAVR